MSLVLNPAHGYVLLTVGASWVVHHIYMAISVVKARSKFGVKYPALYADATNCPKEADQKAFNCVQRGHQNCLENQPCFLALLLCAGSLFPVTASIAGASYLIGRVLYFSGYSTGDPKNRTRGAPIQYAGLFTLVGATFTAAYRLLSA